MTMHAVPVPARLVGHRIPITGEVIEAWTPGCPRPRGAWLPRLKLRVVESDGGYWFCELTCPRRLRPRRRVLRGTEVTVVARVVLDDGACAVGLFPRLVDQ